MTDIVERLEDWSDFEPMKKFCVEAIPDINEAAAEIKRLRQVANEAGDQRRHLEDVSCRQQNEIKSLNTRITNLWYALDRVKHGAEYCDTLGDIIDAALNIQQRAEK